MLIAVGLAAVVVAVVALPVETIGTRFGGIPRTLPLPALPAISLAKIQAVLPDAFAFALLGAIESLLSAIVADGMTGSRHRSHCEQIERTSRRERVCSERVTLGVCLIVQKTIQQKKTKKP